MRLSVGFEEIRLTVTELLGEGLESLVVEEGLIARELQELRVGARVRDGGEIAVVELEPLLGPAGTTCLVSGLLAISANLLAAVSELGLLGSQARAILVSTSESVRAG